MTLEENHIREVLNTPIILASDNSSKSKLLRFTPMYSLYEIYHDGNCIWHGNKMEIAIEQYNLL